MQTYRIPRKIFKYHPKGRSDKRSATNEMDQFALPGDRNRPKGLNIVDDDDKCIGHYTHYSIPSQDNSLSYTKFLALYETRSLLSFSQKPFSFRNVVLFF
jgi:hypothetical protein